MNVPKHLALICAALSTLSPAAAQKSTDILVSQSTPGASSATRPRVASATHRSGSSVPGFPFLSQGVCYVLWAERRNGPSDIFFNRSMDGGGSFGNPDLQLNSSGSTFDSENPSLHVSCGALYAVWEDGRNGSKDIYFTRSTDRGATWLDPQVRVDTGMLPTGLSRYPEVSLSSLYVYVVWEDSRNGASDIFFNASHFFGENNTWLAPDVRLDTDAMGSAMSQRPQIVSWGTTNAVVVWEDSRNGAGDIYMNRTTDGGATWLANDVRIDSDAAGAANSSGIRIDHFGQIIQAVWVDDRTGHNSIFFDRSEDGGATWLASDVQLDTGGGSVGSRTPRISTSGDHVYIAWTDNRNGAHDVFLNSSADGGATWLTNDVRADTNTPGATPSLNPDVYGWNSYVFVAWEEQRSSSKTDIYFNRSLDSGATWLDNDVRLDRDGAGVANSVGPRISGSEDHVHVVGSDERNGSPDIYFNIPFGFQTYGIGKPGSDGWVPQITGEGFATPGSPVWLDIGFGLGGASGVWLGGDTGSKAALPYAGGTILVNSTVAMPFTLLGMLGVPSTGYLSQLLTVPNDAQLIGRDLYFQAVILDAGATFGVSFTNGLEMWIG